MLPPAFLYVGYVALKYFSNEEGNWMKWVINKYTVGVYYCSLYLFISSNWTDLGTLSLKEIHVFGSANIVLYPIYGEWGILFINHIKLLIVSIILTLLASRRVIDKYVKFNLTSFSLTFILTYI